MPSLSALIDRARAATRARLEAEKHECDALAALTEAFPDPGDDTPRGGKLARARWTTTESATVTDWPVFLRHAARKGNESLIQQRASLAALRERGGQVPGAEIVTSRKLEIKDL